MAVMISAIFDDYDTAEFAAKYLKERGVTLLSRKVTSLFDRSMYDDGTLTGTAPYNGTMNLVGGPISYSVEKNNAFGFPGMYLTYDKGERDTTRSDVVLEVSVNSHEANYAESVIVSQHGRMVRAR